MSRRKYFNIGIVILAAFLVALCLAGPDTARAQSKELFLYCGAGLRQPVEELIAEFQKETGWKVNVEFGGSGQLLTRYKATGAGDVFLPGSHFYVDKLEKDDLVAFRKPVALHIPVVAVNKKRADKVKTFSDLAKPGLRVGLGDPKAMALGRTTETLLDMSGMKEAVLKNVVTRAGTVKQLTLYVVKGDVDAAIVARADAIQNPDTLVFFNIDPGWYSAEIITVAALKTSSAPEESRKLADHLSSDHAVEVFGRYGFLPTQK